MPKNNPFHYIVFKELFVQLNILYTKPLCLSLHHISFITLCISVVKFVVLVVVQIQFVFAKCPLPFHFCTRPRSSTWLLMSSCVGWDYAGST